jgi:hypothetical protein
MLRLCHSSGRCFATQRWRWKRWRERTRNTEQRGNNAGFFAGVWTIYTNTFYTTVLWLHRPSDMVPVTGGICAAPIPLWRSVCPFMVYQPSNLHLSSCCQLVHLHFAYFKSVTLLFHSTSGKLHLTYSPYVACTRSSKLCKCVRQPTCIRYVGFWNKLTKTDKTRKSRAGFQDSSLDCYLCEPFKLWTADNKVDFKLAGQASQVI